MATRSMHTSRSDSFPLVFPRVGVKPRGNVGSRPMEVASVGAVALTALRVVAGLAFWTHGAQKLFGWFGGMAPAGGTAELTSIYGIAGILEVVLGAMIIFGVFTRVAAFIASGEMAVAYFLVHVAGNGSVWWWANGGELALLYAFIWLYIAAVGAGPLSIDAARMRREAS